VHTYTLYITILFILLIVGQLKVAANIVMILVMANDVLAHSQIKDGYQRMSLPLVFILMLTCRLLIYVQDRKRTLAAAAAAAAAAAVQPEQDTAAGATVTASESKQSLDQESKKTK